MKNIAISLHAGTPNQRNSITTYLSGLGYGYWHWNDDFWIVRMPDEFTSRILHENIESNTDIGTPTMLVFEFNGPVKYWGRQSEDAWKWLKDMGSPG